MIIYKIFILILFLFCYKKTTNFVLGVPQNRSNLIKRNSTMACIDCHAATTQNSNPIKSVIQDLVIYEGPDKVAPDTVFIINLNTKYINFHANENVSDNSLEPLRLGAVIMLPDGFKIAPLDRWIESINFETTSNYFTKYNKEKNNIIIGPLSLDTNKEIKLPLLSPKINKNIKYGKYMIDIVGIMYIGDSLPPFNKICFQTLVNNKKHDLYYILNDAFKEMIIKDKDKQNKCDSNLFYYNREIFLTNPYNFYKKILVIFIILILLFLKIKNRLLN